MTSFAASTLRSRCCFDGLSTTPAGCPGRRGPCPGAADPPPVAPDTGTPPPRALRRSPDDAPQLLPLAQPGGAARRSRRHSGRAAPESHGGINNRTLGRPPSCPSARSKPLRCASRNAPKPARPAPASTRRRASAGDRTLPSLARGKRVPLRRGRTRDDKQLRPSRPGSRFAEKEADIAAATGVHVPILFSEPSTNFALDLVAFETRERGAEEHHRPLGRLSQVSPKEQPWSRRRFGDEGEAIQRAARPLRSLLCSRCGVLPRD
jgi:hypothetical protein